MDEFQQQVSNIFMPHAMREIDRVRKSNIRFAHYTSADAGLKILRSGRMFLRNSLLMNDFSEVQHGLYCLHTAYNGPLGERFKKALRPVQGNLPEILEDDFDEQISEVQNGTYIASLSEHLDGDEDKFGRLSMWRAYAQKDGIAFVMNNRPFFSESNALAAFISPVAYLTVDDFQTAFEELVTPLEKNTASLEELGGENVRRQLLWAFRFAVQSTKHPSFREEREWRIIYTPNLPSPFDVAHPDQDERIPSEVMSLGGVPQQVYSIPFKDYPDEGFVGATIPDLLDRILIGPSLDADVIKQAFIAELTRLKVPSPEEKVVITGVPLRQ